MPKRIYKITKKRGGWKHTQEWKDLKRIQMKGNLNSKGKKKPPITKETREKLRQAKLGKNNPMFGKKFSLEHRTRLSKSLTGLIHSDRGTVIGENHWNYKDGISKIDKLCRSMPEYKQWRSNCFVRDNWTCQTCRTTGVYITVHHKKGFNKIIRENNIKNINDARKCNEIWDITNGITLCEDCHKLTDNYKGKARRNE